MRQNGNRFALFVVAGEFLERRTGLHEKPGPLYLFAMENESIRALPETDWDILGGPQALIAEQRLPLEFARELIENSIVEVAAPPRSRHRPHAHREEKRP